MERKIPVWLLALVLLLGINFTLLFGGAVYYISGGGEKLGKLSPLILSIARFPILAKDVLLETKSRSHLLIPNKFPEFDGFKKNGVVQVGALSDNGYLLLSAYDNNKFQSSVKLIRISDQHILYEWAPNMQELLGHHKSYNKTLQLNDISSKRFRIGHPLLLNDGSLIYHNFEGPLFKIDVCSKFGWIIDQHFHHAIEQDSDGNIWVSSVIEPSSFDQTRFPGYRDDAIAKVSPDGRLLFKKSVSKILDENGYRGLLFGVGKYSADAIHLNEIQPALYTTKYWSKGDLLLSMRNRSTILIYRPRTNTIIWLRTGPWLNQHDVEFVGESNISVLGNDIVRFIGKDEFFDNQNNIYLFNFENNSVTSPYSKILKELEVRTSTEGRQKILENGDVFIEETNSGRILRVSPEKGIWEFLVRVDNKTAGMVSWSRYLTSDQVKNVLPVLENSRCQKN